MSETSNQALVDALVKFQRWCDGGGLDYEAALAAATKRAEDLQAHYDRDTAKLQQEIARLTAANGGNYWRWQGDGGDYLESLTCPILIDVGQLHEILSVNRSNGATPTEATACPAK